MRAHEKYADSRSVLKMPDKTLLCSYSNNNCGNPRAMKRNGTPHSLCQYHRESACATQRVRDEIKRQRSRNAFSLRKRHKSIPLYSPATPTMMRTTNEPAISVEMLRCKYSNCGKPRALQSNGFLHSFCQEHRDISFETTDDRRINNNYRYRLSFILNRG